MFINFSFDFLALRLLSPVHLLILALQTPPVRLLSPVCLFGTREYPLEITNSLQPSKK